MSKIPGFRSGKTWKEIVAIFGYFLIIVVILSAAKGGGSQAPTSATSTPVNTTPPVAQTSTPAQTPTTEPTPTPTPEPVKNKPTISKSEFEQLKSGMSYEDTTAIIGGPGEILSESGTPGDQYHTVMYQYKGEGGLGANANLMFQGDRLENKAQYGLK
jgi:hypothetical protein